MTIYIGLNEEMNEALKKGIYEPGVDDRNKTKFSGVEKLDKAIITAYNIHNGTYFTDFLYGCSNVYSFPPCVDIYELDSPLLKRFLFPIYEDDLRQICLESGDCSIDETVDKLIKIKKVYDVSNKHIVYIIPYIKSDWIKEKIN